MSFVFQTLAIIGSQFPEPIFEKSAYPHPTPFCYVLQIKDLQRSVGDRYANKGLTGETTSEARSLRPGVFSREDTFRWSRPVRLMVGSSPIFLKSFLCISANSAFRAFPFFFRSQKVKYNAVFVKIHPQHAL
jgi:hypothetical protein